MSHLCTSASCGYEASVVELYNYGQGMSKCLYPVNIWCLECEENL